MDAGDQPGYVRTCQLSWSYLHISGILYHFNCTHPTPLQSLHQLEQSPSDMQGLWIYEVVHIPAHVHPLDTIGNKTRQTKQYLTTHQQSNVGVDGPSEADSFVSCSQHGYTSGPSDTKAHINYVSLNVLHVYLLLMAHH